jgi:hypothetical protein
MVKYSMLQIIAKEADVSSVQAENIFYTFLDQGIIVDLGTKCKLIGIDVNEFIVR